MRLAAINLLMQRRAVLAGMFEASAKLEIEISRSSSEAR
jgi:hypothetical protein